MPDFWKVFHAGDCTVHRTSIASLGSSGAPPGRVLLRNGASFDTDYLILCTGFDKSYHQFDSALQATCGLIPPADDKRWAAIEAEAERTVDTLMPGLAVPPEGVATVAHARNQNGGCGAKKGEEETGLLHGPSRHYRRLIVPGLAAGGDRSVFFPGFIHTIYTPLVSEVQALWGVAFMLGLVELPPQEDMEREVAQWNVWARKRYLAQGRKHAYAIYDFFAYIDVLLGDLGIKTARKSNPVAEFLLPKYPRDYKGLTDEFRLALARKYPMGYDIKGRA